jgi:hypothetical protein
MDVDSSNPQDNRIFEVAWIDGKPNGRNTEADNLAEQLVALSNFSAEGFGVVSRMLLSKRWMVGFSHFPPSFI